VCEEKRSRRRHQAGPPAERSLRTHSCRVHKGPVPAYHWHGVLAWGVSSFRGALCASRFQLRPSSITMSTITGATPSGASLPQIWETGASPPIIIGFVAIGAFTFAITILVLCRRTARRRNPRTSLSSLPRLPDKPQLHDMLLVRGDDSEDDLRWANIMPVSVTISPSLPIVPESQPPVTFRPSRYFSRGHRRHAGETGDVLGHSGSIQVMALLAMPSPRRTKRDDSCAEEGYEPDVEYSLATLDVPWRPGSLPASAKR